MKKSFLLSVGVSAILVITAFITGELDLFRNILFGIGLVSLLISGLFSGTFLTGAELRANYHSESKESRNERHQLMGIAGIFAIVPLAAAICFII
ncbi:hypothetical protein D8M04_08775 [Oceanobacillus piezotolerans]|uniref:DUF5316 domain-containing protein n=1 Tax=Oceanobacillus piezotolerans TaxID=2448030 RepID=A0A498D5G6_9BACI|nr:DUF5316 family protein [Oceanobacillus piezotolerans]RLL44958.1 hypothetical protein D8M04_08775 [Oceanobacillus piezotolerans]